MGNMQSVLILSTAGWVLRHSRDVLSTSTIDNLFKSLTTAHGVIVFSMLKPLSSAGVPLLRKIVAVIAILLIYTSVLLPERVDAISEFQIVHGVVWYDDNNNGKFDTDEIPAGGIGIQVGVNTAKYFPDIAYYRATVPTGRDGQFVLALLTGHRYDVDVLAQRKPVPKAYQGYNYHANVLIDVDLFNSGKVEIPNRDGTTTVVPIGADVSLAVGLVLNLVPDSVLSDYIIGNGRFFEQTGGRLAARGYGFPITHTPDILF